MISFVLYSKRYLQFAKEVVFKTQKWTLHDGRVSIFLHNVENIIQLAALISFLLVFTDSVGTIFYFLCVLISKQEFRTNYLDKDWILENALSFLKSKVLNLFSRMLSQSNIDNFDSVTMITMIFINTCKLLMNVSMAL